MNRFFVIIILIIMIGCNNDEDLQYSSENFELIELSTGVFACIHKVGGKAISNAGIIDNGHETIIFDCFLAPHVAEELVNIVELYGLSPIKYVVNSHFHNDHIRGNQVFGNDVRIISTSKTAEMIRVDEPEQIEYERINAPERFEHFDSLKNAFTGDTSSREFKVISMWQPYYETLMESYKTVKTRIPDMIVDTVQDLSGPGRNVQLIAVGKGHTESDMVLYLEDDKVLFAGDLVFNEHHPYLGHGFPKEWKQQLLELSKLDIEKIVPGHGQIGEKNTLYALIDYITFIEALVKQMKINGIPIEQADEIEIPEKYNEWWFDRFFLPNIMFMHGQIDQE